MEANPFPDGVKRSYDRISPTEALLLLAMTLCMAMGTVLVMHGDWWYALLNIGVGLVIAGYLLWGGT